MPKKYYIDTNYIIRLITKDNKQQHIYVQWFLRDLETTHQYGIVSQVVFFEINWVLSSFYEYTKQAVVINLKRVLRIGRLFIENKHIIEKTLMLYSQLNLDLEDCYHIAWSKHHGIDDIATFDKKLLKTWHRIRSVSKPLDTA